ncbi:unnamed protein product, partial [Ilex paraguariensis]
KLYMARHLDVDLEAIDPIEGLFFILFAFLWMGALLLCMARTKRPRPNYSPPEDPNVQRKKARKEARLQWIQGKSVT